LAGEEAGVDEEHATDEEERKRTFEIVEVPLHVCPLRSLQ
jgi:hypothetical protein